MRSCASNIVAFLAMIVAVCGVVFPVEIALVFPLPQDELSLLQV
jgi:hypothetical protein